ncbi:MAG: hypothetical protein LC798_19745 [Chloroflexi bacterium]|nr:hypothetical protein [Chloroflexota bacterium]
MSVDVALIVVGAAILVFGLPSNIIKRLWLSVPLLALLVGAARPGGSGCCGA